MATATRPPATATPLPAQSPVVIAPTDTPPGIALAPGTSWRIGNQVLTLMNPRFAAPAPVCGAILEFEVTFENAGATEAVVGLHGADWFVTDEAGAQLSPLMYWQGTRPMECGKFTDLLTLEKSALAAREKMTISIQVRGKLPENAAKLFFQATKAGRITGARWEIPVPR